MPLREDTSKKIALDLPYVQFKRDRLKPSRNRTSWPSVKQVTNLTGLQPSHLFSSNVSKTGLGATVHPAAQNHVAHKKTKPFSFALQHKREFPWSSHTFMDDRDFTRRSYEKPDKKAYRLPVDPISRLVWDEQVAPPVGPSVVYNKSLRQSTTELDFKDDRSASQPASNLELLPLLQNNKSSKLPFTLLKYAKIASRSLKTSASDDVMTTSTNDKLRDSGYGSRSEVQKNAKTTLPELKKSERPKRPANISRYHANCYDSDDDLDSSWTLPRIEMVLKSEGVEPGSISNQIEKIRTRKSNHRRTRSLKTSRSEPMFHTAPHGRALSASSVLDYDNERRLKLKQILTQRKLAEEIQTDGTLLPNLSEDPDNCKAREAIEEYFRDIENIRWVSQQQIERGFLSADFPLPRVVLISSQVPEASGLLSSIKDHTVLPILYDYSDETFGGILRGIRLRLDQYRMDYNMKSLLIYCQGGLGYFYFLRKKIITLPKLQGSKHKDMSKFFTDLGGLISKVNPKQAFVHLVGPRWDKDEISRSQFMETLQEKAKPNVVHFDTLEEENETGKVLLELYFDYDKYQRWKSSRTNTTEENSVSKSQDGL